MTQPPTSHRRRWLRGLAAGVVLMAGLSVAARTDLVLGGLVEGQLEALGERVDGQFSYQQLRPTGLDGVELQGLSFAPNTDVDAPVLTVSRIQVFPSWRGLLRGHIGARRVDVHSPELQLIADSDGAGHVAWLDDLSSRLRADATAVTEGGESTAMSLPLVRVIGGRAALEDPSDRYPAMEVVVDEVVLTPARLDTRNRADRSDIGGVLSGEVEVAGLGRALVTGAVAGPDGTHVGLQLVQDNDFFEVVPEAWTPSPEASLSVGAIAMSWPPEMSLAPIRLRQMNLELPGIETWRLDDAWIRDVRLSMDRTGYHLDASGVALTFSGLLDHQELELPHVRVSRSWDGETSYVDVALADELDRVATLRVDRESSTALTTARVESEGFDTSGLLRLWPDGLPVTPLGGVFAGELLVEWLPGTRSLSGYGAFEVVDTALYAPVVASDPMRRFEAAFEGRFELGLDEESFRLSDGELRVGEMPAQADVFVRRYEDGGFLLDTAVSVAPMPAQTVLESLPVALVPVLQGYELEGEFGFDARFHVDTLDAEATVSDVTFHRDTLRVAHFGPQAPIPMFADDTFEWGTRTFEGGQRVLGPGTDRWVDLDHVPHHLYRAILAAEDDGFWRHEGFEWRAISRALRANIEAGRFERGGSTISQQVVKNLFLTHDRTFSRKLQELFLTWQLEEELSKTRILEIYLNLVHWGPGIYGISEASMAYFEHVPRQVTLRESAFLAAILPNPVLFGEQYARSIVSPSRRQKMRNILRNMHRRGYLTDEALAQQIRLVDRGQISMTPHPRHLSQTDVADADGPAQFGALVMP